MRSLAPLLTEVIVPLVSNEERPLLAFGMTQGERNLLGLRFPRFVSASLYGTYGKKHIEGVDVRDLTRYEPGSMVGAFGSLLFDYFDEHDVALAEVFRVLDDGGVFFTHIAPYRLTSGMEGPRVTVNIKARPDYFGYVPSEDDLPTITVGREWFLAALQRADFAATHVTVGDGRTDRCLIGSWA